MDMCTIGTVVAQPLTSNEGMGSISTTAAPLAIYSGTPLVLYSGSLSILQWHTLSSLQRLP